MAITITGITPATGPVTGGTSHLITGTQLDTVAGVTIGGAAVTAFTALSPTLMRVTAPAGSAGAVNVVLNPGAITGTGIYTYVALTGNEQLVSTLARKWVLEVKISGSWVKVRAMGEMKATVENGMQDDSDYDSGGWESETKTSMKWGIEAKLLRKVGFGTGTYDPGQEALRAAAVQFGTLGIAELRWYDRNGGPEAFTGFGSVSWEPEGGDTKALESVTVKISGQGARTTIANPA